MLSQTFRSFPWPGPLYVLLESRWLFIKDLVISRQPTLRNGTGAE